MRLFLTVAVVLALASPAAAKPKGQWLAGDMHVHTCYSHDAYCGPTDDNTGPDTFYSSGGTVGERFAEAAAKGLDFVNISDHDDIRAWTDPAFGSYGIIALHGYEASLAGGHAHVVGVNHMYAKGPASSPDEAAASARTMEAAIDADGGMFQANHPSYREDLVPETCDQMGIESWREGKNYLHWKYGFEVVPNSLEVWNPTALLAPAEAYWECWLQRGVKMPATAGSDTHGALGQVGTPTTWVFSGSRREHDIVTAIEAGRTSLSRLSPSIGGLRLVLEGDSDGDGKFESMIGDTVAPGSTLRVRAEGLVNGGLLRVRANGRTLLEDQPLAPGGSVTFKAPNAPGWVRANLYLPEILMSRDPGCSPNPSPISLCSHDLAVAAMTSPIYLGTPQAAKAPKPAPFPAALRLHGSDPRHLVSDVNELDGEPRLRPALQSRGA